MSTEYHKISTPFKRHFDGPDKGKLIMGDWAVPELEYLAGNEWEFTEKVDGTNIRISLLRSTLINSGLEIDYAGRTDNANIPKHLLAALDTLFVEPDRMHHIEMWMEDHRLNQVTLYGEGYGPKIQKGGGNYRSDASFVLFDVKIGDFWLDRANVNDVAEKLGIDSVPVIGRGTLYEAINIVKYGYAKTSITFGENPKHYGMGRLDSQWGDFEAEGIVARPTVPLFTRQGNRIITKIKGVDFK